MFLFYFCFVIVFIDFESAKFLKSLSSFEAGWA